MKAKKKNTAQQTTQRLYAVVLETLSDPEFTCTDENGNPWIFTSEVDGWKNIAESIVIELTEFIEGRKEYDSDLFVTDMHIVEVRITCNEIFGVSDGFRIVHQIIDGTSVQFWDYDEKPF